MEKRLIVIFLLFITACENKKHLSCVYELEDKKICIDIDAVNDDISTIHVRNEFVLPRTLLFSEEYKKDLDKQLDDTYHYEDNILVKEYDLILDDVYSYDKTKDYLNVKRYHCE